MYYFIWIKFNHIAYTVNPVLLFKPITNGINYTIRINQTFTILFYFTYSGPKLCNELPFLIRQAYSHHAFKAKVKSLILNDDVP